MRNENPDNKNQYSTLPLPAQDDLRASTGSQDRILPSSSADQHADDVDTSAEAGNDFSPHQRFLLGLHDRRLGLNEIQVEWERYYNNLTDDGKRQVWEEFKNSQPSSPTEQPAQQVQTMPEATSRPKRYAPDMERASTDKPTDTPARPTGSEKASKPTPSPFTSKLPDSVQRSVKRQQEEKRQLSFKEYVKSLFFGLTVATVFLAVSMFTFFNESYIIPFIQPSTLSASTQIIISPEADSVDPEPKIIIPKLNVEAPVVYDVPYLTPGEPESDFERRVQTALESGVVHYPSSQRPGEKGVDFNSNVVIVGHSTNNIFNRGEFKFAFMQLRNLELDDTFVINYDGKQYVYKVYDIKRVAPTDVWVLGPAEEPNTATLITCDPPGFNVNRLVVFAKQISPNPNHNVEVSLSSPETVNEGITVPGNPQSLWSRIWSFFLD